jgi:hypothetical protein
MSLYERIEQQSNRLGSFESDGTFGQSGGDQAAAIIDAVGRATIGVTSAITTSKTARTRAKYGSRVATTQALEATKQAAISARGATALAREDVRRVGTTYSTMAKLILGIGAALAVVIVSGGFAYKLAVKRGK